jgi:hypothetical protein
MAKRRPATHKDVDFEVFDARAHARVGETTWKLFNKAAAHAVTIALSGGKPTIDIVVHSAAGARWLGGSDAVAQYEEDPEASVFERIEIKANSLGRLP